MAISWLRPGMVMAFAYHPAVVQRLRGWGWRQHQRVMTDPSLVGAHDFASDRIAIFEPMVLREYRAVVLDADGDEDFARAAITSLFANTDCELLDFYSEGEMSGVKHDARCIGRSPGGGDWVWRMSRADLQPSQKPQAPAQPAIEVGLAAEPQEGADATETGTPRRRRARAGE